MGETQSSIHEELPVANSKRNNFPSKLHTMLEILDNEGMSNIVSWQSNGRAFRVLNMNLFEKVVLPRFFRHSKMTSFQRQLNIYNFQRYTISSTSKVSLAEQNAYYHEYFIRDHPELVYKIERVATKGQQHPPNIIGHNILTLAPTTRTSKLSPLTRKWSNPDANHTPVQIPVSPQPTHTTDTISSRNEQQQRLLDWVQNLSLAQNQIHFEHHLLQQLVFNPNFRNIICSGLSIDPVVMQHLFANPLIFASNAVLSLSTSQGTIYENPCVGNNVTTLLPQHLLLLQLVDCLRQLVSSNSSNNSNGNPSSIHYGNLQSDVFTNRLPNATSSFLSPAIEMLQRNRLELANVTSQQQQHISLQENAGNTLLGFEFGQSIARVPCAPIERGSTNLGNVGSATTDSTIERTLLELLLLLSSAAGIP